MSAPNFAIATWRMCSQTTRFWSQKCFRSPMPKNFKIIYIIYANHKGMKLEIKKKTKTGKFTHGRRLNNMFLNKQVKEETKKDLKKCPETKMETQHIKN